MCSKFAPPKIWKALALTGLWLTTLTCFRAETAIKASSTVAAERNSLIQVQVHRLVVDPASQQPVVTLVDTEEKRAFPIWIGFAEARAIHSELQGIAHFRPQTHDLLSMVIRRVDGKVNRIIISHTKDNVFYATLVIEQDDALIELDARPSDSIVMALKFKAPIYISKNLFLKMSIPMEGPKEVEEEYGISLQEITPELAQYLSLKSSRGVMISAVRSGSRAEKDGLQSGDILVAMDGQPVEDVISVKEVMVKRKTPLNAEIMRKNQLVTITIHLQ